ncbi:MAG: hypothetical protein LCH76_12020 [Actinobacteria bacterium]|nr:hypothetical protein [Actinomycetota bacterium]
MAKKSTPKIETTRAPRGELTASALVDAIVASPDDRIERHYLEVKSTLDLTDPGDRAKLAKFVLGAGNRMPDKAATAFEGCAVMVIGASSGSLAGIPPIEALDIENAVAPFIGADGPRWDLVRVPVPGSQNDVLLLIVDPPTLGQPPFICQKDGGGGLQNGAVYVRSDGSTHLAKADELKQLFARGASVALDVDFDVSITGDVKRLSVDFDQPCDDYIDAVRTRLLDTLEASKPKPKPDPTPETPVEIDPSGKGDSRKADELDLFVNTGKLGNLAALTAKIPMFPDEPEKRTEAEYKAEIDAWEKKIREGWTAAVLKLVAAKLQPVTIQLANRVETYFHDVQLKIHLEGDVHGFEGELDGEADSPEDLGLPSPPRKWGPTPNSLLRTGHFDASYLGRSIAANPAAFRPSRVDWHNSGSVDITFNVGDLRPNETDRCDDGDLTLTVPAMSETEIVRGTWEITARDHHKVYRGRLSVPVDNRDLTADLRIVLGLEHERT